MGLTMSHVLISDMCLVMSLFPEWNTCSDLVHNLLKAAWSIAPSYCFLACPLGLGHLELAVQSSPAAGLAFPAPRKDEPRPLREVFTVGDRDAPFITLPCELCL